MIRYIVSRLPKGAFGRSIAILVTGTSAGQIVLVLASPLLTRIYTPADFGVAALFAALLGVFSVVANLRYERAIPLPKDKRDAGTVLALSLIAIPVVAASSAIIVGLYGMIFLKQINASEAAPYLWLVPVGVISHGVYQSFNYWAIRRQDFRRIATTRLSQSIGTVLVQMMFTLTSTGPFGLIAGRLVGQSIGVRTLAQLVRTDSAMIIKSLSPSSLKRAMASYKQFPLYSSWSGVANAISGQLPTVLLLYFFGPVAAGYFALSGRILQSPMVLVGTAINHVFYASAPDALRAGRVSQLTETTFRRLVQIALPIMAVAGVVGPEVFSLFFGAEWRQAGVFVQWLAPWLFLEFLTTPLSGLPAMLGKQREELFFRLALLILRTAALVLGGLAESLSLAIALFGAVSAACWLIFLGWNLLLSKNSLKHQAQWLLKEVGICLMLLAPAALSKLSQIGHYHDLLVFAGAIISMLLAAYRVLVVSQSNKSSASSL